MNCKNCEYNLTETAQFCQSCGAKVVQDRITVKKLRKDFFNDVLGWDNAYFKTFKTFLIAPNEVALQYISGTRKRFIQPFTFLAIGMAIATFVFNSFSEEYVNVSSSIQDETFYKQLFNFVELQNKENPADYVGSEEYNAKYVIYRDNQIETNKNVQKTILKYFNIMVFLSLPIYTYIAFIVFGRKRFNYGEHLVINAYIQGFTMVFSVVFFFSGILVQPYFYFLSLPLAIFYYLFTYKKLYNTSWGVSILKFLKFLVILFITIIGLMILGFVLGFLGAMIFG
ncbi:DUF3667 domain-containing protein [uncultured Aquimarina sp.]|uniref:DUF3667 domain-containing protein n=1 Tax=uncultured Aquimarina sp. TaxID=575652 RepID=UPI00263967EA|nr:DUF3667 domain-containing protein [uncultured Aquimarina sp.]